MGYKSRSCFSVDACFDTSLQSPCVNRGIRCSVCAKVQGKMTEYKPLEEVNEVGMRKVQRETKD